MNGKKRNASMNDWIGGYNSVFKCLGGRGHGQEEREVNDYYATDPMAVDYLVENNLLPDCIWECACGEGHLSRRLEEEGYDVYSSDLVDRGYGVSGVDFLKADEKPSDKIKCIVTNPPYKYATEFVLHAIDILKPGDKIFMFLKTTFLEGRRRKEMLFDRFPPRTIYQFSGRVVCAKNGDFGKMKKIGSAVAYAWYEWEIGSYGTTALKWI